MASTPLLLTKKKPFPLFLLLLSLTLLLLIHTITNYNLHLHIQNPINLPVVRVVDTKPRHEPPTWYQVIIKQRLIKPRFAFVNAEDEKGQIEPIADVVTVDFDHVAGETKWEDLFPEWVDEEGKWGPMKCPEIPVARGVGEVAVVVARVERGGGRRDVRRLQVNLVAANVLVDGGWDGGAEVYAVFVGETAAMWEIFRCDELIWEEGEYRIYKVDLRRLKEKVFMPLGSCMISPPFLQPKDQEQQARAYVRSPTLLNSVTYQSKDAYVTVLHSSEMYICGAIALAQSIIQTNSTKDLVLLADDSISLKSIKGLEAAGWKIKRIERIRSPHAKIGAYNEYNYSKLRIWQLIEYDKVIFIDADLIVLKNMDYLFLYPQLSAVGNDGFLFNSGVMLVEPSKCMFNALMEKKFELGSYNGGDQGFLNEVFTWWHRWPSKINCLKVFDQKEGVKHEIRGDSYTIHYLGLKPWMCYKDYDCNWDMLDRQRYASDSAHEKWWKVYDDMPLKLKSFCGLTKQMDKRIQKWRGIAKSASFPNGHWKVKVKDKRRHWL